MKQQSIPFVSPRIATICPIRLYQTVDQKTYASLKKQGNLDYGVACHSERYRTSTSSARVSRAQNATRCRRSLATKNVIEKNVYISNAVFGDDQSFVQALIRSGINTDFLYQLSDNIKIVSRMEKQDTVKGETYASYLTDVSLMTTKLVGITSLYFGIGSPTVVLNKIFEVLAFHPELFEEAEALYIAEYNNWKRVHENHMQKVLTTKTK